MMLQLNPPLPMNTPKGEGFAHVLLDYGPESDLYWTVLITATGEIWTYPNYQVRAAKNITLGRAHPDQPPASDTHACEARGDGGQASGLNRKSGGPAVRGAGDEPPSSVRLANPHDPCIRNAVVPAFLAEKGEGFERDEPAQRAAHDLAKTQRLTLLADHDVPSANFPGVRAQIPSKKQ